MKKRLDFLIANAGLASRTEAKKMIRDKRITADGTPVTDPGAKFDPEVTELKADGRPILFRSFVCCMMNKPQGVICATEDRRWKTVCDLLPDQYASLGLYPAGRLDRDTEGFVLLSNDGELAHRIISPKHHISKRYYAQINGKVTREHADLFSEGICLEDGYRTLPAELTILASGEQSEIELVIYEGKFHQVKRMFEAIGCQVTFLKRLEIGPLRLDPALAPGQCRELTVQELSLLKEALFPDSKNV
ncbi:MAG: pseudouridine synthase [Clostridia bacterium]|nr:pseudouridine synthase [Clostridia bacterium]